MRTRSNRPFLIGFLALMLVSPLASSAQSKDTDPAPKAKQPTAKQLKIAEAIANGHSYDKHVVKEKLFPEVKDREDFAKLIGNVIANAPHYKDLENDRAAYYDQKSN